jgi:hypothetical protein
MRAHPDRVTGQSRAAVAAATDPVACNNGTWRQGVLPARYMGDNIRVLPARYMGDNIRVLPARYMGDNIRKSHGSSVPHTITFRC